MPKIDGLATQSRRMSQKIGRVIWIAIMFACTVGELWMITWSDYDAERERYDQCSEFERQVDLITGDDDFGWVRVTGPESGQPQFLATSMGNHVLHGVNVRIIDIQRFRTLAFTDLIPAPDVSKWGRENQESVGSGDEPSAVKLQNGGKAYGFSEIIFTVPSSAVYTFSVIAKAGNGQQISLGIIDESPNSYVTPMNCNPKPNVGGNCFFHLTNNWQQFHLTVSLPIGHLIRLMIAPDGIDSLSSKYVYVRKPQLCWGELPCTSSPHRLSPRDLHGEAIIHHLDGVFAGEMNLAIGEISSSSPRLFPATLINEELGDARDFTLAFSAVNGSWVELLRMRRVHEKWLQAFKVIRQHQVIRCEMSQGFPENQVTDTDWTSNPITSANQRCSIIP